MNTAFEMEEEGKSLTEYLAILKRRKKLFIIPALVTMVIAVLAALLWPPSYRSTATILIEEQEVPPDLVRSTITTYANQQIQVITQRIMTLGNIINIVDKYGLYEPDEIKRTPKTEIAKEFQEEMILDVMSAEVIDPRSGRPTEATIAFTLSFDHGDPSVAQKVTNELVNLYLNENLKQRTQKSASTSQFLQAEAMQLRSRMKELENQIATFKEENKDALPELSQYNLSLIDRLDREISDGRLRIKELEKRRLELDSKLAQTSRYAPTVMPTGEQVLGDYDRLKALKSELNRKSSVYSESHPDVVRLKREIESLENVLGGGISSKDKNEAIRLAEDQLAELRDKYTADHPEVIAQERIVEGLKNDFGVERKEDVEADNPTYVLLDTQKQAVITEIKFLRDKLDSLQTKLSKTEAAILKAPEVEKKYNQMLLDLQNTTIKYREVNAKQMEAELAQSLEQERKGQRFTLIDPPIRPEEPVSPNRIALLLVGVILAVAVGVAFVAGSEVLDESVRGEKMLSEVSGSLPLVTIPYWKISEELHKEKKIKYWAMGASAGAAVLAIVVFHFAIKPLDVTWFILMNKLGLS